MPIEDCTTIEEWDWGKWDKMAAAIKKIHEALSNEGSHPEYHRALLERHRRQWPVLWDAIDHLLESYPYKKLTYGTNSSSRSETSCKD